MKKIALPACILILVVVALYLIKHDFALCGIVTLTGFLAIACYAASTEILNSVLSLQDLEHTLNTNGSVNVEQTLKGYKLEIVSELKNFRPVNNYFLIDVRKHDSDDYLKDMKKTLFMGAILYIFTTLGYIMSFLEDAKKVEGVIPKTFYGYLYVMSIAFYTAYYLAPILLFAKKNSLAIKDAQH